MQHKTNDNLVTKLRIAAVTALIIVLLLLILKAILGSDHKEIEKNTSMPEPTVSVEPDKFERIDRQKLLSQFTYDELYIYSADSVSLSTGGYEAEASELLPVYNSVFSKDGLQIASLADSKLRCRKDAVNPLSEMLCAFYEQTGLRTIMIMSAYIPTEQPGSYGYYDEYGNYYDYGYDYIVPDEAASGLLFKLGIYDEEHGKTDFLGDGEYAWFAENAYAYGFVLRYPEGKQDITAQPYDPALFRYVGKETAALMQEYSLCLEELPFFAQSKSYENAVMLLVDGKVELIYTVPYQGLDTIEIQLPSSPDGTAARYSAYTCGDFIMICAEPPHIPYIETEMSEATDNNNARED